MAQGRSQKLVDDRAREWFMLRHERRLSPREETEFEQWLAQPGHGASYRQLEQICEGLRAIAASGDGERLRARPGRGDWRGAVFARLRSLLSLALAPAPALAMVAVFAVGLLAIRGAGPGTDIYSSDVAQTRTVTLEDGSEITLGADSRLEATLDQRRRHVMLVKGQAFFAVAPNPERPFYVTVGDIGVRVVGTRFEVHRAAGGVRVAVEEGAVDVGRSSRRAIDDTLSGVRLHAGQGVRMDRGYAGEVESLNLDELAGWRHGKLIYRDAPLAEVVADANRYRRGEIVLGAPQLAELRVTTSFSADQVETMISMLEQSLPVSVYREAGNRVVIWPRMATN